VSVSSTTGTDRGSRHGTRTSFTRDLSSRETCTCLRVSVPSFSRTRQRSGAGMLRRVRVSGCSLVDAHAPGEPTLSQVPRFVRSRTRVFIRAFLLCGSCATCRLPTLPASSRCPRGASRGTAVGLPTASTGLASSGSYEARRAAPVPQLSDREPRAVLLAPWIAARESRFHHAHTLCSIQTTRTRTLLEKRKRTHSEYRG